MVRTEHPADVVTAASQPCTRTLSLNQRQFWIIIGVILLAFLVLRVSQIGHGLPDVQMGDENSDLSTTARMLVGQLPKVIDRYTRTIISNVELIGFGAIYIDNLLKTGDGSAN